jgi:hypothetical protein
MDHFEAINCKNLRKKILSEMFRLDPGIQPDSQSKPESTRSGSPNMGVRKS